ncbi:MAG: hypothetical protein ABS81_09060 [Pseudonocardia sp. SCN 72-86]|nr:MAG: hypothetical protein ABS81_09060 [Pseudonocardia sp. SCN 72-86]
MNPHTEIRQAAPPEDRTAALRRVLASPAVLLGVVAPIVSYQVLTATGVAPLPALAIGTVFPLAGVVLEAVRARRLDIVNALSLAAIVVGLTGGLLFGSTRFLVVKDAIITGTVGLVFLGSLAVGRPLLLLVSRRLRGAVVDASWAADPGYRHHVRVLTAGWGLAMVAEASIRITISAWLEPGTQMIVGTLLSLAVFGATALWTVRLRATRLAASTPSGDVR